MYDPFNSRNMLPLRVQPVLILGLLITRAAVAQKGTTQEPMATRLAALTPAASQTGLLVVAHGATPRWNEGVRKVVAQVTWDGPVAVAFLMGEESTSAGWDSGVAELVKNGAREVVVVPLMVSSHGGHYKQVQFYAGAISEWPEELRAHSHGRPAAPPVPMRVTAALDDSPELGAALLERWRTLSPVERARPLLLVAHGPSSDAEAALWLAHLETVSAGIRGEGRIPVAIGLLRDDASPPVRAAAIAEIHATVARLARQSNDSVTALPVLISSGRIDAVTIPNDLKGLPVRYSALPLSPLAALARWIERVALAKRSGAG
jgi:sirohydrochlorin cobaltochelatase